MLYHLSKRALQVLEGHRDRTAQLETVCGWYRDSIITEYSMIEVLRIHLHRKWLPTWAEERGDEVCGDCWPPQRGPILEAFLISADQYLERPLPEMVTVPPPPRSNSVIKQLFRWIRETGPKRKSMQDFVYQRAHPGAASHLEVFEGQLRMWRASSNQWGTNWARLSREGRIVQRSDGRWDVAESITDADLAGFEED